VSRSVFLQQINVKTKRKQTLKNKQKKTNLLNQTYHHYIQLGYSRLLLFDLHGGRQIVVMVHCRQNVEAKATQSRDTASSTRQTNSQLRYAGNEILVARKNLLKVGFGHGLGMVLDIAKAVLSGDGLHRFFPFFCFSFFFLAFLLKMKDVLLSEIDR
jgi:hypothetical protein